MLHQLSPRLYIGDHQACDKGEVPQAHEVLQHPHASVHACKHPCHQRAVGYTHSLPKTHPHYLVLRAATDLYLNMIDPDVPLFQPELFWSACEFIDAHIHNMPVIIHCNSGQSRAPSIALIYLVTHDLTGVDPLNYRANDQWMLAHYTFYNPGLGIMHYFHNNWETLLNGRPPSRDAA